MNLKIIANKINDAIVSKFKVAVKVFRDYGLVALVKKKMSVNDRAVFSFVKTSSLCNRNYYKQLALDRQLTCLIK